MNAYLAARFSRLPELADHANELESFGIPVTSRWLRGGHEWVGTPDHHIPNDALAKFAAEDLEDIDASEVVICFTETPRTGPSRGGRHWEAGYAYARGKRVIIVGETENIFYALPAITQVDSWEDARNIVIELSRLPGRY